MPYNTRRVSLSLPSLGIQLPGSHGSSRASQHHHASSSKVKSPVAATTTTTTTTTTSSSSSPSLSATASSAATAASSKQAAPAESPPAAKRVKRSHTLNSIESPTAFSASPATKSPISLPSRSRKPSSASVHLKQQQQQQLQQQRLALLGTPPPSPRPFESNSKLDLQGINDDVVVAVLQQLESTGNRPHLIKELAAVLVTTLKTVESSQNPVAIISSRLTNYLKRPWTALAPCPLTKEQVTVHPRRVYYYLTTMPRQEIPEYADNPMAVRHVISPSISSGPDEEEDVHSRLMHQRSPSPEVDFSGSDETDQFDHVSALNGMSFTETTLHDYSHLANNSSRLASPPLEHDEREFTQTASVMQQRKRSEQAEKELKQLLQQQHDQRQASFAESDQSSQEDGDSSMSPKDNTDNETEPTEDNDVEEDLCDATDLPTHSERDDHGSYMESSVSFIFGQANQHLFPQSYMESPVMRPQLPQGNLLIDTSSAATPKKLPSIIEVGPAATFDFDVEQSDMLDVLGAWGNLKSPENVELAELDDMFGSY